VSRFPFPRCPEGWFQVADSDELAAGAAHRAYRQWAQQFYR
jgi:hypothetical protein